MERRLWWPRSTRSPPRSRPRGCPTSTIAIRIVSGGKSSYLSGKEDALHLHRAWRQRAASLVHLVSPTEVAGALASYDFDVYLRR